MIIPLGTDSRLRQTPYMNWALIAANVIIFVLFQHLDYDIHGHLVLNMGQISLLTESRYSLSPRVPVWWAFLTYAFMHAGWMHLIGNMLFLYIFGNNVNDKMGHVGYLGFYLAGAVCAGIAYVLMQRTPAPVIGASGAIAAVTGAYLVLFPRSNVSIFYIWFFFGRLEVPSLWFIVFFFCQDLFFNFAGDTSVAHVAHIGGTIFGFSASLALLSLKLLPRDQFDLVAMVKQWNRRRQYRDMVSRGYNPFDSAPRQRPGQPPPPPDPKQEQILSLRAAILEAVARHDLPTAAHLYVDLKQLDPQQALPKNAQLDVANQLAGEQRYPQAAEAYESLLRVYPKAEQIEQVELMLGLIYARYLGRYDLAKQYLQRSLQRLHDQSAIDMAREELMRIEPLAAGQGPS
ncbi:MAG TPA: rhomboid family intramembrane serine protease [Tepidisphaeraceae bacterium]|nr:rhomboid family intramembrane serine protease [Tepidisphaeraceae bacterium]